MRVLLKYGEAGLPVEIPETPGFLGVWRTEEPAPLAEPEAVVSSSLKEPLGSPPLSDIARGRRSACVVVSDVTRPVPNPLLLPPILQTLEAAGVPRAETLILVATGIHRPTTPEETVRLVGPEVARRYLVVDHRSKDRQDMVEVGRIGGSVPALVNRRYVESDLKILTGFIEPHMWAGYSGGRKAVLPGISSIETLRYMHGPEMVAHPRCRYGALEGNPFHEAGLEVLALAGAHFLVNVALDTAKRVTGIFSGHPVEAHREGCRFVASHCVREVDGPLDFLVTTNAGAPLDCNLYQTVKGIAGAAPAVKKGGDILIASRCPEGLGSPEFQEVLALAGSPGGFLDRLHRGEFFLPDQWCAQELYQNLLEQGVWVYSEGLGARELERCHLRPAADVESAIRLLLEKHGPRARWAVVPDGPLVILSLRAVP